MKESKSVGRIEIKKAISQNLQLTMSDASNLVDDIIEKISSTLKKGKAIKISSFGTFIIYNKKARLGRNPKTKKDAIIEPRKTVSFRASKKLKQMVDQS